MSANCDPHRYDARGECGCEGPCDCEGPLPITLTRPLVVLDLETSGTNVDNDRILELGVIKVHPDGRRVEWSSRFNPGVPIPAEATAIHGITDQDVSSAPPFAAHAARIARALAGCDIAGHNIRGFDLRMLAAEMRRAGLDLDMAGVRVIDTLAVYRRKEPRDLSAAVARFVSPAAAEEHAKVAHGALPDCRATLAVLAGQMRAYPDLPRDADSLHEYCLDRRPDWIDGEGKLVWRGGEACIGFGKHGGVPLRTADRGYLKWLLNNDFPTDTKDIVRRALAGEYPAAPKEAA